MMLFDRCGSCAHFGDRCAGDCREHPFCRSLLDKRAITAQTAACGLYERNPAYRPGWDEYYMNIAQAVSLRATCDRKHVGAVLVKDNSIIATGYNGSLPGQPHCSEVGCMVVDSHCERTVHAEANALVQAARHGNSVLGATIYTTASPCWICFRLIVPAGIKRIVFGELYRDERIRENARLSGVELTDLSQR